MKSILTAIGVFLLCGSASACYSQPPLFAMPAAKQMPWAVAIVAGMLLVPAVLFCCGCRVRKGKPMPALKRWMAAIGMILVWGVANLHPSFGSTLANLLMFPELLLLVIISGFGGHWWLAGVGAMLLYRLLFCDWLGRYYIVRKNDGETEEERVG